MQNTPRLSWLNVRHKLALTSAAVTVLTALATEAATLGALAARDGGLTWGWHVAGSVALAAALGAGLGWIVSRRPTRRLRRVLEVSQAWLRGNLALRIADPTPDDLGALCHNLDQLAEHLEEDEQDLGQLRERNARLTDQVRALAVVEERNRLARELHDSVKQHLFSLTMTTSAIRARLTELAEAPGENAGSILEMAEEIQRAAQTAQRETTRLIEDLRPGSLEEQGLSAALNDYTLLFGAQEHLLVYLEVQGDDALLSPSVAEALYRVAQEALHNVARHAHATRVDVHLRCTPERVALTIEDNGIGFDTTLAQQGLGLANMQERLMGAGGRLTLESQSGIGTTILAEVGLPHPMGPGMGLAERAARPNLSVENWSWLGAKLVIPVGQAWPWLPADLFHLRSPLLEPAEGPLKVRRGSRFFGLQRTYDLLPAESTRALVRVHPGHSGYEWEAQDASWALRRISGVSGRMVLTHNQQPLAAMQYQGRQMDTWTELIYDGRGYRLAPVKSETCAYELSDERGETLICARGTQLPELTLSRALPMPLVVMITARILDETIATGPGSG